MRRSQPLCLVLGLAIALSAPLAAEIYTVTLGSGVTFETRYAPLEEPSDSSKVQFLTDTGNWITLPAAIISSITAETETDGYGRVIAVNTIEIGMSLNDLADPDAEAAGPVDPAQALVDYFQSQQGQERDYSVEQFVEPEEAGRGGLPVTYATRPF
jgi:hypothetical protein